MRTRDCGNYDDREGNRKRERERERERRKTLLACIILHVCCIKNPRMLPACKMQAKDDWIWGKYAPETIREN